MASQVHHVRSRCHLARRVKETHRGVDTHVREVAESCLGVVALVRQLELNTLEIETRVRQATEDTRGVEALVRQVEVASLADAMLVTKQSCGAPWESKQSCGKSWK